jgi:nucleoside-diphosphate-sugar epimerase
VKALFIGGTGTISSACVGLALQKGWEVTLLNRGNRPAPPGCKQIVCDINDEAAASKALEGMGFDTVAQFYAFVPGQVERDIRLFAGKTGQYMFISSASAYQRTSPGHMTTESTPLNNPHWQYSRDKAACEDVLAEAYRKSSFPATIVRPSHTYGEASIPLAIHGEKGPWQVVRRIMDGKPVIVHGDGTSLWTLTHSSDFAVGFVGLMGNPHAVGEAFHITSDEKITWNMIYECLGRALGKKPKLLHVSSEMLIGLDPSLEGPLLGDKAPCVSFDNAKIKRYVPEFCAKTRFDEGIRRSVGYFLSHPEMQEPDYEFNSFCDKVAALVEKWA